MVARISASMHRKRRNLRVIIQFVRSGSEVYHALVAYGSTGALKPVNCQSMEELIERFECAGIPAARRPKLVQAPETSQIVYSAELRLSDEQLRSLGLIT